MPLLCCQLILENFRGWLTLSDHLLAPRFEHAEHRVQAELVEGEGEVWGVSKGPHQDVYGHPDTAFRQLAEVCREVAWH